MFVMDGPFEIVSCVGTLSMQGMHIHASVSDSEFKVFGGHIVQGSQVKSTKRNSPHRIRKSRVVAHERRTNRF
ncbi:DNA-binding protein [Erysipelothrix sp. D19-032]